MIGRTWKGRILWRRRLPLRGSFDKSTYWIYDGRGHWVGRWGTRIVRHRIGNVFEFVVINEVQFGLWRGWSLRKGRPYYFSDEVIARLTERMFRSWKVEAKKIWRVGGPTQRWRVSQSRSQSIRRFRDDNQVTALQESHQIEGFVFEYEWRKVAMERPAKVSKRTKKSVGEGELSYW